MRVYLSPHVDKGDKLMSLSSAQLAGRLLDAETIHHCKRVIDCITAGRTIFLGIT